MKLSIKDILLLCTFLLLDIVTFHSEIPILNLLFKPWFTLYLAYSFYKSTSNPLSRKNQFLLIALSLTLLGEFLFPFRINPLVSVLIILIYLIEHQIYISIFREEKARLSELNTYEKLLRFLPFLISAFLFFGFMMMPNIPDNFLLLGIIYCVQLCVLAALAVTRITNRRSYKLVIVSLAILIFSDAMTSYLFFIGPFPFDYEIIRIVFLSSKVIFVLGIANSVEFNHLEKEYK
jgi:hypothetical protein